MFRKVKPLLVMMLFYSIQFTTTQAQQSLTLKQCVEYSLSHHPSTQIYKNEVQITNQRFNEGLSAYLPQINGSATFDDNLKRQTTIIPAGQISPTPIEVQFGNQYSTNAMIQADQVIYDQSLITGLQSFTPAKELTQLQQNKNDIDLIYNTAAAYYQVFIYKEEIDILRDNEQKFNDLLRIQELQFSKGVIQKVDVDRVRINITNIVSRKKVAEANLELAKNRLKNAMGMEISADVTIADSVEYSLALDLQPKLTFDLKAVPDYQIQDKNITMQKFDYSRKKATFIPTLSFYARYGAQSFGNDFGQSFNKWYDYSSIGLKLSVPVFDGMRKYSVARQSKLSLLNMQENMKIISHNLELQYENASTQLLSSYSTLQSNRENVTLAKEVFNTTELQYKKGAASLTDLLNSDYAYKEAESNYISSLLRYLIARLDIEKAKGTLKENIEKL